MKKLLGILVLGLLLSTNAYADDISDFQIERISIGDSILDYYSKKEIKKNKKNYTKDKTFSTVEIQNIKSGTYDGIQLNYKTKDKKYIIFGIHGIVDCRNNFSICENEFEKTINELLDFFGNSITKSDKLVKKHAADKSGKSISTSITFTFENGDETVVSMTDWSKKIGYWDNLKITLSTKELSDWYENKAFK